MTPAPAPLPTTRPELERTRLSHRASLARADRALDDFVRWDGMIQVVRVRRR